MEQREIVKRREDPRLLTGRGHYVADLQLPGMLDLAFARSSYPHAVLLGIDTAEAQQMAGVACVLTGRELLARAPSTMRSVPAGLALDRVRYFGEPVAVVAAATRYLAEDAAERINVNYDELPAVVDPRQAVLPGAVLLYEDKPRNVAAVEERSFGDFETLIPHAEVQLQKKFSIHRAAAHPLETRGIVAAPNPDGRGLTVWAAHQGPHRLRNNLMNALGLPAHQIRVIIPDVGGGFGQKNGLYPEDIVCCYLALALQRPVRWIEDRQEHFVAAAQEREQYHEVTLLARRDGTLLGLRDHYLTDQGAYLHLGTTVPLRTILTMPGPYRMEAFEGRTEVVYTNKPPTGPYRGAGRPQGNFIMERVMDLLARRLDMDPVEVRRKNLIRPDELPFERGFSDHRNTPVVYDSGDFNATLDLALQLGEYNRFRRLPPEEETVPGGRRKIVSGIGLSCSVEDTGGGGFEGAMLRLEPGGRLVLYSGSAAQGQGHETTFARIAASALGVQPGDITVILGDTSHLTHGVGTFGSRSTVVAGGSVYRSSMALRQVLLQKASVLLEVAADDLTIASDRVYVTGSPERFVPFKALAQGNTDLAATDYFHPSGPTYANGVHLCRCTIDLETMEVKLDRYTVAHDCGKLVAPQLVEGQIHGGVLHGVSTALFEEHVLAATGQPITTSYRDYLIPESTDMPVMDLGHLETPSPLNPLGVKGAGEGGTIPALAAVANAVEDALRRAEEAGLIDLAPEILELPITPERLYRLMKSGDPELAGASGLQ